MILVPSVVGDYEQWDLQLQPGNGTNIYCIKNIGVGRWLRTNGTIVNLESKCEGESEKWQIVDAPDSIPPK